MSLHCPVWVPRCRRPDDSVPAEYRPRGRRRGRFEITSPDDDEVVDLEEESGVEDRRWSELIQPRLLHP